MAQHEVAIQEDCYGARGDWSSDDVHHADPWLDGQQSPEAKRGEDTDHLAGYPSAAWQGHGSNTEITERHGSVFIRC